MQCAYAHNECVIMQGECRYAGGVVVQLRYAQDHLIKTCSGCIPRVNVMPDPMAASESPYR